jgi:hypothetical protein
VKNILLLGLLPSFLFIGCSLKEAKAIKLEEIVTVKVEEIAPIEVKEIKILKVVEEKRMVEETRVELKRRLDEEALTNADKELKAEEVRDYKIDENTPLILKNQSEEKAYE